MVTTMTVVSSMRIVDILSSSVAIGCRRTCARLHDLRGRRLLVAKRCMTSHFEVSDADPLQVFAYDGQRINARSASGP
jgi:hypothetical protein